MDVSMQKTERKRIIRAMQDENEKDLIGRVKRIHRDERRLEKQQKLVERETIWMEKMDALLQLALRADDALLEAT